MGQFVPATKAETWIMTPTRRTDRFGKPLWARLRFNLVEYDNEDAMAIEPVNAAFANLTNSRNGIPVVDGEGSVRKILYTDQQPYAGIQFFGQ